MTYMCIKIPTLKILQVYINKVLCFEILFLYVLLYDPGNSHVT